MCNTFSPHWYTTIELSMLWPAKCVASGDIVTDGILHTVYMKSSIRLFSSSQVVWRTHPCIPGSCIYLIGTGISYSHTCKRHNNPITSIKISYSWKGAVNLPALSYHQKLIQIFVLHHKKWWYWRAVDDNYILEQRRQFLHPTAPKSLTHNHFHNIANHCINHNPIRIEKIWHGYTICCPYLPGIFCYLTPPSEICYYLWDRTSLGIPSFYWWRCRELDQFRYPTSCIWARPTQHV